MISEDMRMLGEKRSVIREIFEYSKKRKAQIGEQNVFDFSLGNPSIPSPDCVNEAIKALLLEKEPTVLHGYTSAQGDLNVRRAVAGSIKSRFGFEADERLVYMSCGAAASLAITLRAAVRAGEEVILLAPYFPEYKVFCENAGASVRCVVGKGRQFETDAQELYRAVNEKTAAVIINSPNNPTGAVQNESIVKEMAEALKKRQKELGRIITVISDDPYREITYGAKVPYFPAFYDNTVTCYSFSKSLSLPGERIGYILVSPRHEKSRELYAAVCGAGRSMGYVCAPSIFQYAIEKCINAEPDVSAYKRNRDFIYGELSEIGYDCVRPDGAFYLFVKSLEPDACAFCERAKKHELLLVPSDDFGVPGYVRIAYCVSYEQIQRSIPSFRVLFDEYAEEKQNG